MEINRNYKLEKAMSKDASRISIHEASVCQDANGNTVAVATNGHILACVPVAASTDELGPLSADALVAARKACGGDVRLEANVTYTLANGISMPRTNASDQNFPQWERVTKGPLEATPAMRIMLNPKLLLQLHEAIGRDEKARHGMMVELSITSDPLAPILVRSAGEPQAFGLIMPAQNPARD